MTDKATEAVARAIFATGYNWPWDEDTSESGDNDREIALSEARAAISAYQEHLKAGGIVEVPRTALEVALADLSSYISEQYASRNDYSDQMRRYRRDMEVVRDLRAMITAHEKD